MSFGHRALFWVWICFGVQAGTGCGGVHRSLRRGDAALERGHTSAALEAYQQALKRRPGEPRALLGLARAYLADETPDQAIAPARAAYKAGVPGSSVVLAQTLIAVGQGAQAKEAVAAAKAERPEDPGVALLVAEAALADGDLKSAAGALAPLTPTSHDGRLLGLAAWIEIRAERPDSAAALASRAAADGQDNIEAQADAAAVFRLVGDVGQARGAVRTARALGGAAGPWSKEAARRDQGGDREGAIRRLSWARALEPDEGRLAGQIGQLYLAQQAPRRALSELEISLTLSPYVDPSKGGVTVVRTNDWPEPTRKVECAKILRAIAEAKHQLGDLKGSATAEQQAVEIGGGGAAAWVAVANAWKEAGDKAAEAEATSRAVALDADAVALRLRLGRLYSELGQVNLAVGQAQLAWQKDPTSVEAALLLGELYERRGETGAARDLYTTALRGHPNDKHLKEALARTGG